MSGPGIKWRVNQTASTLIKWTGNPGKITSQGTQGRNKEHLEQATTNNQQLENRGINT